MKSVSFWQQVESQQKNMADYGLQRQTRGESCNAYAKKTVTKEPGDGKFKIQKHKMVKSNKKV